jgi:GDPmannose 4,6-dehydratase
LPKIKQLHTLDFAYSNSIQFLKLIEKVQPDEIYNFAGVSDIFDPWTNPEKTFKVNGIAPQWILESIVKVNKSIKFFQASSCLVWGNTSGFYIDESTSIAPIFPYGFSKAYADACIKKYRDELRIFAVSGFMGSHESLRRGDNFFTKRIVNFAKSVKAGSKDILKIGNIESKRNLSWAPDVIEATYLMLQAEKPKDYIIANDLEQVISNEEFIEQCFNFIGKNWKNHIEIDDSLKRPKSNTLWLDASAIYKDLGWKSKYEARDIAPMMMKND